MILPRFSLRFLLGLTTVFGLLSVVFALAYQGEQWAIAASYTILVALMAPLVYAGAFVLSNQFLKLRNWAKPAPRAGSPFAPAKPQPTVPSPPSASNQE